MVSLLDNPGLAHRLETALGTHHVDRDEALAAVLEVVDPVIDGLVQALRGLLGDARSKLEELETSDDDDAYEAVEQRVAVAEDALSGFRVVTEAAGAA